MKTNCETCKVEIDEKEAHVVKFMLGTNLFFQVILCKDCKEKQLVEFEQIRKAADEVDEDNERLKNEPV